MRMDVQQAAVCTSRHPEKEESTVLNNFSVKRQHDHMAAS